MKAISIMATLVVDSDSKKLFLEAEVLYEDGTVRSVKTIARSSVRIDLDTLYAERDSARPPG